MNNEILQRLISDLGIDKLGAEDQKDMVYQISNIVYGSVLGRASTLLSTEQNEALNEMFTQESKPEEVEAFLRERIPSYDDIVAEEFNAYKEFILSQMTKPKEENAQTQPE